MEILKKLEKHDERFNEIMEEIKRLQEKAAEHDRKFNEIMEEIRRLQEKAVGHDKKFNDILAEIASIRQDIVELKRFQEKVTVSTGEEAIEVVDYFLEKKYGIKVALETIYVDSKAEIDVYGVKDDLCVFGEASVRLGLSKVRDLLNKFNYIRVNYPQYLRNRVILVLYGMRILPKVREEAERYGIWVVTANRELTEMKIRKLDEI